jgi:hypothetical protein
MKHQQWHWCSLLHPFLNNSRAPTNISCSTYQHITLATNFLLPQKFQNKKKGSSSCDGCPERNFVWIPVLNKAPCTDICWEWRYSSIHFKFWHKMEDSYQLHIPAPLLGRRLDGPQNQFERCGEDKNLMPSAAQLSTPQAEPLMLAICIKHWQKHLLFLQDMNVFCVSTLIYST